jgi:hypothetical protein
MMTFNKLFLILILLFWSQGTFAEGKKIIDPFEDKGISWEELQKQLEAKEKDVIKLVCNDTKDPSLPLSIYIYNNLGMVGSMLIKLEKTDVMYILSKKDETVELDGIIQRNDGRFSMSIKIGKGEAMEWRGFCKKNEPKF